MSTRTRLAAFALALGATFATGWGIGAAVGPLDDAPAPNSATVTSPASQPGTGAGDEPAPVSPTTADHTGHQGAHP